MTFRVLYNILCKAVILTTACGGTMIATESWNEIASPNFPNPYPDNKLCEWNIITEGKKSIRLSFQNFSVSQI